ncbi:MAG: DUF2460 domain-containing protein [Acidobacteriia bacterium]|nr:DUF2460 domain-containing protein [Terriglobia bacterium]
MQYPAWKTARFSTQVQKFLDGSEQRYRDQKRGLKKWTIALSLLNEGEVSELVRFFESSQGQAGSFEFFDPWEETVYPDCSFENAEVVTDYAATGDCRLVLKVAENWS